MKIGQLRASTGARPRSMMTAQGRLGVLAMALLSGACHSSAPVAEPAAKAAYPPTPDDQVPFCKSDGPKQAGEAQFDPQTMQRPKPVSGEALRLPEEILDSGVHGLLIVKCLITKSGSLEDCCMVKGVDGLTGLVFDAVRRRRYEPAKVHGEPVDLRYVFNVKIVTPQKRVVPFPPGP